MTEHRRIRIVAVGLLLWGLAGMAMAACDSVVGTLATLEGQVSVQSSGAAGWQPGELNQSLCKGDTVRAGERSRATVVLVNQAVLRIDQNTAMRLDNISGVAEEKSFLSLLKGTVQSFSRKPRSFEVSTPYLNGSIEGTEFVFRADDAESVLTVFEGVVLAANDQGSVSVTGGQAASAGAGQAPQARTVVRPRDAAQWSLYYPPVLAASGDRVSESLQGAAADLSVGRVDAARAGVEQAIADGGADAGLAYALRAVINVVQNNNDLALADARQAVALSPDSAAAKIAYSYALQAGFKLPEARDVLQQAVAQHPDNALAYARLAELQLMLGDTEQATASARKAAGLAPALGRSQITLGFAALAGFRNDEAEAAFRRAIELDSADPLPHLGLGLARISAGDLTTGRGELELAVGLDSNSALLRAYLGKAYFEEKRAPLDGQQFGIASELDPLDPTPWLYQGIALQTENRPVEAADALGKSVALNDNRATYRSRLLLDKDRAARGTSQARIYSDLGFAQEAVVESTGSLALDPANASAHRFLSDSHRDASQRSEIARVSELFQAQMLQETNINPVQPSISSTNLNITTSGGPASAGFNEFTPLFERNRSALNASLLSGSNQTGAGEAVLSGTHDSLSGSIGAFGFSTDGFRENAGYEHEIYTAFGQWAISPHVNVQVELDDRKSDYGDIAMHFDPMDYDPTFSSTLESESGRIGLRLAPNGSNTVLLSAITADRSGVQHQEDILDLFGDGSFLDPVAFDGDYDEEVNQYDAQYIYQQHRFNITAGAAYTDSDRLDTLTFADVPVFFFDDLETEQIDLTEKRLYAYGNITLLPGVIGTIGVSYQDFSQDQAYNYTDRTGFLPPASANFSLDLDEINPKLGLRAALTDDLELRAAYFEVIKPPLSSNRTLEPTQVAGFNQFFDDANLTQSKRYGVGLDGRLNPSVSVGGELTRREIEGLVSPLGKAPVFEDRDEWTHRLYADWTPRDDLAVSLNLVYDRFENMENSRSSSLRPHRVTTWSAPLGVRYFHPNGLFAGAQATWVDQDVVAESNYKYQAGTSTFTLVDLVVGYRIPKRHGILSFGVMNVFDRDFDYLDNSYRTFQDEPTASPYLPERTVMGRLTVNF